MRKIEKHNATNAASLYSQLANYISSYSFSILLNNHSQLYKNSFYPSSFDTLSAFGVIKELKLDLNLDPWDQLKEFYNQNTDWIFGHLSYDLKNFTEDLRSDHSDSIEFPLLSFVVPEVVIKQKGSEFEFQFHPNSALQSFEEIFSRSKDHFEKSLAKNEGNGKSAIIPTSFLSHQPPENLIQQKISKDQYLEKVESIKSHIQLGDIYEANFCNEYYCPCIQIDPYKLYLDLQSISPSPFSAFYRKDNKFLLSSSPERYLLKKNDYVLSQPIKGTSRRGKTVLEDERIKEDLSHNSKERAENIMIVDLVRNDLSRSAQRGSVNVEELCGIYTYPQVHQMISSISCKLRKETHPVDLIKNSFPMGSMTGAPKIRAMEIIEEHEKTRRGIYSGSVGYFSPERDFDFSVIIRSFTYNMENKHLSWIVGGAITILSDPEKEYEECEIKAKGMKETFINHIKPQLD